MTMRLVARLAMASAVMMGGVGAASANGWYESRPWQFDTSADKANKAAILDLIERKKGGYYDGFSTTINNNNTTNVGTQINCNNLADATANEAANSQTSNSPDVNNQSGIDSSANGNVADNDTDSGWKRGSGSGVGNDQDNSGSVSSGVDNSETNSSSGAINVGDSDQDLKNHQNNSGNQYASISGSTACDMTGSVVKGNVRSSLGGPLN